MRGLTDTRLGGSGGVPREGTYFGRTGLAKLRGGSGGGERRLVTDAEEDRP